jgi:hypothetical protein
MKQSVEKKISSANQIDKNKLVDQLKSGFQEKYDQMIVDADADNNHVFYIRYHARFVSYKPKRVKFILDDNVSYEFGTNYDGRSGRAAEVDPSFISKIERSETNISSDNISAPSSPGIADKIEGMSYLKESFQKWASKNGAPFVFGENIGSKSKFASLFESSSSGSSEYSSLKSNYFSAMDVRFNGTSPSENQPLYFIPDLTSSKDCNPCHGQGKSECTTCSGTGQIKCPGKVFPNKNGGPGGNVHFACKNGKIDHYDCDGKGCIHCNKGKVDCPTCSSFGGNGKCPCSKKYNSKYGVGKLYDSVSGTDFCEGSGVITCKNCKGHGKLGEMVYVELEPQDIDAEYYMYQNEIIPTLDNTPESGFKYLDKDGLVLTETYIDNNGSISNNYDDFTRDVCRKIEEASGLSKDDYPKLFLESVYYDVIPAKTLGYLHILTSTQHKVSFVDPASANEVMFHSNPTAVSHFSLKNIWLIYKSKWAEAFITKSYRQKRDKYNEIKMLIYIAKADGMIEEEEKLVLANRISGLKEYTASEKAKLFKLMSSKELPALNDDDFVISNRETADEVVGALKAMSLEDKLEEREEVQLVKEYSTKIDENLARYKGKFKQFITTWQVSLSILIWILSLAFSVVYFMYLKPKKDAYNLHAENLVNEKLILDFITWTAADTIQNTSFVAFESEKRMNNMSSETEENHAEESSLERMMNIDEVLLKINHNSNFKIEGTTQTYAEFWAQRIPKLKKSVDSLNVLVNRRKDLSIPSEPEKTTAETTDGLWYTVSDPDGYSNLRATPDGEIIKEVYEGTTFQVIGTEGEYKKVRMEDGVEGYIHSSRVVENVSTDGPADAPTGPTNEDGYEAEPELDPEYQ